MNLQNTIQFLINLKNKILKTELPEITFDGFEYLINTSLYKSQKDIDKAVKKKKITIEEKCRILNTIYLKSDQFLATNKVGNALKDLFYNNDYIIGVHCSGLSNPNSILDEGLKLTGHLSSGVISYNVDLDLNIHFDDSFERFLLRVYGAANYKTAHTGEGNAVIIAIPKKDINDFDKILLPESEPSCVRVLKKEYIIGYIPVIQNKETGQIILGEIIYNKKSDELSLTLNNK